jgi:hypothetical protein
MLNASDMLVIALAPLIVEPDKPLTRAAIEQGILQSMGRPEDGCRHLPDFHLQNGAVIIMAVTVKPQNCLQFSLGFLWCNIPYRPIAHNTIERNVPRASLEEERLRLVTVILDRRMLVRTETCALADRLG